MLIQQQVKFLASLFVLDGGSQTVDQQSTGGFSPRARIEMDGEATKSSVIASLSRISDRHGCSEVTTFWLTHTPRGSDLGPPKV